MQNITFGITFFLLIGLNTISTAQGINHSSEENVVFFEKVKTQLSLSSDQVIKIENIFNANNKSIDYQYLLTDSYKMLNVSEKSQLQISILENQLQADYKSFTQIRDVLNPNQLDILSKLITQKAKETGIKIKSLESKINTIPR